MGSPSRSSQPWRWGLALSAFLLGGLGAAANPLGARSTARTSTLLPQGASAELLRTKKEQALIRAEGTAVLLRALAAAPILSEGER